MQIITNGVPRYTVDGYDLTAKERAEFDYMPDIDSGLFFRYRGNVYDIGEFMRVDTNESHLENWHGYSSDSMFSGVLIRLVDNGESVIVARYYS